MKRFTNHRGEEWGSFVDIKEFDYSKINPKKYDHKNILISSVMDPYFPLEKKFERTKKILEQLIKTQAHISILTKSKLVSRDIDLFKQFKNIEVGVSLNTLDTNFARLVEPYASSPQDRIDALKIVKEAKIPVYLFISPIFPKITDYKAIIDATKDFVDYYRFENLNFRPHNIPRIYHIIQNNYPDLIDFYKTTKIDQTIWDYIEEDITQFCQKLKINYKIHFNHGGFSKKK